MLIRKPSDLAPSEITSKSVYLRRRAFLGQAVALGLVAPLLPETPAIDPFSPSALVIAIPQVLIGIAMGLVLQLVFAAVVLGAQLLAMSMGLGFASMIDPQNGVHVPVVSQYYLVLATLIFLALDGHLVLVSVLADSFQTLPVGTTGLSPGGLWSLVAWGSHLFAGGVLIALPVVTATLVTNIAFGVITRAAPQLNIFAVGFPVTMLVGFMAMMGTLAYLAPQVSTLLLDAYELMRLLTLGDR